MPANLRILSSKADSKTWESFTRSKLKLESVSQWSLRSDIFRKRTTKPLLKQKHRQKHLTWAKKKNNWTVAQWSKVLFSDESKCNISFGNQCPRVWRKSGEAQNPCCLKSSMKFPQSLMIWAAMSSAGVGPLCLPGVTVLDWPANSPKLTPIENLWGIVKRKMRDTRPNNADDLKAAIKATWASITPEHCHRLITSMPRHIDAVIHAKGGSTKY